MVKLLNGSRVAIVGGGPAGSFMALHLLRMAEQVNLRLEIDIFEARDFKRPGPGGCNKCAGILSSKLFQNLKKIDLELPEEIIQARLDTYVLHLRKSELPIRIPEYKRPIISVYRGSGPRLGNQPPPRSFDEWLLDQAQARGAVLHHERVRTIRPGLRPTIFLSQRQVQADLVVLATGINSQPPLADEWGYRPPNAEVMAQNEIILPSNISNNQVHIFYKTPKELIFGALVPKGQYANISLLGHGLQNDVIEQFLNAQNSLDGALQNTPTLCGCKPRVAVSPGAGYFADHMVAIGDSAVTRLYKDGLGSAFITAQSAARTALEMGISKQDFEAGYQPVCRQIARDNFFGHVLFRFWLCSRRLPVLIDLWSRALLQEARLPEDRQILRQVLAGLFTGDESYQKLFMNLMSRSSLWSMGQSIMG